MIRDSEGSYLAPINLNPLGNLSMNLPRHVLKWVCSRVLSVGTLGFSTPSPGGGGGGDRPAKTAGVKAFKNILDRKGVG